MAVDANSYGTAAGVAAHVPRIVRGTTGLFDATTRPTITTVETWLDEVSALLNAMLAQMGFTIPISQADAKRMLDLWANQEVAAICEGVNGAGRFRNLTDSRMTLMASEVQKFIEDNARGIQALGAPRARNTTRGLHFRSTDERGNAVHPLFQRDAHGDVPTNWDDDGTD